MYLLFQSCVFLLSNSTLQIINASQMSVFRNLWSWNGIPYFIGVQRFPRSLLRHSSNINCTVLICSPKNWKQTWTIKSLKILKLALFFFSSNVNNYMYKTPWGLFVCFCTNTKYALCFVSAFVLLHTKLYIGVSEKLVA